MRSAIPQIRWLLVLALIAWGGPAWSGAAAAAETPKAVLDGYYDRWLAGASLRMLDEEARVFSELEEDVHREVFIRRFWQARIRTDGDLRALERWQQDFEEAGHRFDDIGGDRAQALLIAGKPASVMVSPGCNNVIRPLRIWSHGTRPREPEDTESFQLVFYLESGAQGVYRHWQPSSGAAPLMFEGPARYRAWTIEELIEYSSAKGCFKYHPGDARIFAQALRDAQGPEDLRRTLPPPPDPAWLDRLLADLETGSGAALPSAPAEISFPGRYQRKTIVLGRVAIPIEAVERNAEGLLFDRIVITGNVRHGDRLVDSFRIVHLVAGAEPAANTVLLDFYRRLRPATYTLSLRVADARGLGLLREHRRLEVPAVDGEATPPAGRRLGLPGLTRNDVGVLTTFPSIEILPPGDEPLVGEVEVATVTTGGPIERIELRLDGALVTSDSEAPYTGLLRLGRDPRRHQLTAVAFDPAGRELARAERTLNAGPGRFAVRLIEPVRGSPASQATVEVDVPAGETLDRVDLYLDQARIATWRQPPFVHDLPPRRATYVRAVATLASGETREDLVFVDSATPVEEIDVQLVELYTSVYDDQGRFVTGLAAEDFRVREDGTEQTIRRFDTVENLAINVALLMDVSSSMRKKLGIATRSAQRFFETVLTPKDRASLLTFNHDIRRVVAFTNDVSELRRGASGFRGWGTTRLHDSVIYAVHSFGGLEGKRALVLLSDGQDVDSDFYFKQVLEYALRSGVAVYPIALGVQDELTASNLQRLAGESGGRYFHTAGARELDQIYRRIEEELRSQYLLVYEPPQNGRRHELRRVEVTVSRPGLRTRSIHGYYP
ncbi:MAG: VWA domain-containing protein [bacterium]|nr:VWA domain-containing protein [bacterium]